MMPGIFFFNALKKTAGSRQAEMTALFEIINIEIFARVVYVKLTNFIIIDDKYIWR